MLDPIKQLITDLFSEAKPLGVAVITCVAGFLCIIPAIRSMAALKEKNWGNAGAWLVAVIAIWVVAGTAMNFVLNLGTNLGDSINQKANGFGSLETVLMLGTVYFFNQYTIWKQKKNDALEVNSII